MPSLREIPAGHIISCAIEIGDREQHKLFFLAAHREDHAVCMKITSVLRHFENPRRAAGVAMCAAGEHEALRVPSAIEPDNCFPIPHRRLGGDYLANDRGPISAVLLARIRDATANSRTITVSQRTALLAMLDAL